MPPKKSKPADRSAQSVEPTSLEIPNLKPKRDEASPESQAPQHEPEAVINSLSQKYT